MKSAITYSLVVLLLCFACEKSTVDMEKETTRLLETDKAFAAASIESGAAEAFKLYLTEDAMQLPQGGVPVFGRNTIYENMNKSTVEFTLTWNPEKAEVSQSGDLGWTWGYYNLSWIDENGEHKSSDGKYLNIWRKMQDGSWKVAVDMGN